MADTTPHADEHPRHAARNARSGFWLFLLYLLFYAGFVAIAAFAFRWLAFRPFGGVNLAILYGLALIGAAFVLAMIYMWFCRRNAEPPPNEPRLNESPVFDAERKDRRVVDPRLGDTDL